MTYFLVGLLLLGLGLLASRWYAQASPHDLAQGGRTFAAVFSGLAMLDPDLHQLSVPNV